MLGGCATSSYENLEADAFGVSPIETVASRSQTVFRLYLNDHYGYRLLVQFQPDGDGATVTLQNSDLRGKNDPMPLRGHISGPIWNEIKILGHGLMPGKFGMTGGDCWPSGEDALEIAMGGKTFASAVGCRAGPRHDLGERMADAINRAFPQCEARGSGRLDFVNRMDRCVTHESRSELAQQVDEIIEPIEIAAQRNIDNGIPPPWFRVFESSLSSDAQLSGAGGKTLKDVASLEAAMFGGHSGGLTITGYESGLNGTVRVTGVIGRGDDRCPPQGSWRTEFRQDWAPARDGWRIATWAVDAPQFVEFPSSRPKVTYVCDLSGIPTVSN